MPWLSPLRGPGGGKTINLNAYPNPTQGLINIDLTSIIGNTAIINIYNTIGQQVYSENLGMIYEAKQQLDLSNLEKGTYLITIETAGQLLQQKIILQK